MWKGREKQEMGEAVTVKNLMPAFACKKKKRERSAKELKR